SMTGNKVIAWTESGLIPDRVIRGGIRRLNHARLQQIAAGNPDIASAELNRFVEMMNGSEVALLPDLANAQHYEVPAEFFEQVLGRHAKYSCCYWANGARDVDEAEQHALALTCLHADIQDGQRVLDLGCGWGSLSLWIAERYPESKVTAVSNSNAQRLWIERLAVQRGLDNIEVMTQDMNTFAIGKRFDRVVSVEMFEHMRNWRELFRRIRLWLEPGGRFFMHVFCHRTCAYEFTDRGPSDWMSRHFFSGGMMPSADLPLRFQQDLQLVRKHHWSGREYERTANAWLERMDRRRKAVMPWIESTYGAERANQWFQRWRIFFMACAETFGYNDGREWMVGHYLFRRSEDFTA
ncbi:MAG: cyclopropane-fatty-acyl-phospholipid synthase family protein, partial [Xanthomonadales bacterium]|nr:cyclopropane-fatty-acyl-phospholipid synthase family protein [Xanthomonadales bacterium]